MADADPFIEHETFALPQTVGFGYVLEVAQDAAAQMRDILDALSAQESGRFLAADAAGAEHRDPRVGAKLLAIGAEPGGKLAKTAGLWVDRARKCADRNFIIIAGVDDDRVWVADQRIPLIRLDIAANVARRVDARDAECHNFALYPHLHPAERRGFGAAIFDVERGAARPSLLYERGDMCNDRRDALRAARDRAVDALSCEQDRALDALLLT